MTSKDTTHAIIRRAGAFLSGTALSRITGMLRDILMAWAFGATSAVAAFMVAFRFAHLLRRIFGEGAMQSAFIPQFEAIRSEDPTRARQFFMNLCTSVSLFLIGIIALIEVVLGLLLYYDLLLPEPRETARLTALMLPGLLFICLFGLNAALLQCEGRYFVASGAPLAFNITWIVGIICLASWSSSQAMPWLAGIVTVACVGQWLATVPSVKQVLFQNKSLPSWVSLNLRSGDLKKLVKALSLGVLGVSASQISSAVDSIFAQYASPEGPAYLWYAIRLQQLPMSLFALALTGALLPAISRAIKSGNLSFGRHLLEFALRQNVVFITAAAVGLVVAGGVIINLLFGHGDFSQEATVQTTRCLWAYALGLLPATLILLLGTGFYALGDFKTPARGCVMAVCLNIILNFLAVGYWEMGPVAVATATSVSSWFNLIYLHSRLKHRLGGYVSSSLIVDTIKTIIVSIIAGGVTLAADVLFFDGNLLAGGVTFTRDIPSQVISCALSCGVFGLVWLAGAVTCRLDLMSAWGYKDGPAACLEVLEAQK